jgi:N-acetylglucosaminyldiphosphoundecaprenol N-acetyl-beta-D-mannosaminyltransferase
MDKNHKTALTSPSLPMFEVPDPITILGQPVHPVSRRQAVDLVLQFARSRKGGGYVCLTNAHTTVESRTRPELRSAVEGASLSVPDGMPLVWILRRRGFVHAEKVTGIELIPMVAAAGIAAGIRHFFVGGLAGVAKEAGKRLQSLVPRADVVGALSPPFGDLESFTQEELRPALSATKPHVLWVGLGAPRQELWMARVSNEVDVPVMVGVGAAFDFLAGTKRSAPTWMRHSGLEWLFRLATEPRRLWRRYLLGNARFLMALITESRREGRRGTPEARG